MKKALITGITGQDGSYLAEYLLSLGYEVHGIIRRSSSFNTKRIDHIFDELNLHFGDLSDSNTISYIIQKYKPDEIYNLGAMSHVKVSFDCPEYTSDVTGIGSLRILEAVRASRLPIKVYQASSSELFGSSPAPQCEHTQFQPQSPYAIAKLMAYWNTINYRNGYNIFASNGILFNHESPRRGETFVTRKITKGIANLITGKLDCLQLGNLDAKRDWGYAPEYVQLMHKILQYEKPEDFVIGTGESHTVREFINVCLDFINIKYYNDLVGNYYVAEANGYKLEQDKKIININPNYFRPTEVDHLQADVSKAKKLLGWEPKVKFKELAELMLLHDIQEQE